MRRGRVLVDDSNPPQQTVSPNVEAMRRFGDRAHADTGMMKQFQHAHGNNTLRGLFLMNGGAAVAISALLGPTLARTETPGHAEVAALIKGCRLSLTCYGSGLIASVAGSALGYLNANFLLESMLTPFELHQLETGVQPKEKPKWKMAVVRFTYRVAPAFTLASALLFVRGGWFITHALR